MSTIESKITDHFQSVFQLLLKNNKIVIPDKKIILNWDNVVKEWLEDKDMTLFARKGSETRGTKIINLHERNIITTDNTPAHWVFKNLVFDKSKITKEYIHKLITSNNFPIAFIRKKNEYLTLVDKMVADKETRLNELGWKLAHIKRIALKRGNTISLEDYKNHHFSFLSLGNMYLIDKNFSGLAEVKLFNDIVSASTL